MDFTPLIAQLWATFSWVIPVILLLTLLKTRWANTSNMSQEISSDCVD